MVSSIIAAPLLKLWEWLLVKGPANTSILIAEKS